MTRFIGKSLSQFLLLLAPMLTMSWSFLNFVGYPGGPTQPTRISLLFFVLDGEKQAVEMQMRFLVSVIGFIGLVTFDFFDTIIPRRDLAAFRQAYLGQQKEIWRKDPDNRIPDDVRINIMHVRRPWYTLFFIGRFHWTWNDGFKPPDQKDANLLLFTLQGVAGIAYRTGEPKAVDFRTQPTVPARFLEYAPYIGVATFLWIGTTAIFIWLRLPLIMLIVILTAITVILGIKIVRYDPFRLWPWQAKKSQNVKYIFSVPLFKASKGASQSFKCVGVLNLDTMTETGAAFLQANEGRLVTYFFDIGKVIACLK